MNTGQIQLRLTLTDQLYSFLQGQASRLGIPVTQVVKHMIIEKVQKEEYPTFKASVRAERAYEEAMANLDKAVEVNNVEEYFKNL
jgi:predicted urease superfamily metal-dependent hydrolase